MGCSSQPQVDRARKQTRDALALQILKTLLARYENPAGAAAAVRLCAEAMAKEAYAMADAMLAESEKA